MVKIVEILRVCTQQIKDDFKKKPHRSRIFSLYIGVCASRRKNNHKVIVSFKNVYSITSRINIQYLSIWLDIDVVRA